MNKFMLALFIALFSIGSINTAFAQQAKGKLKTPAERAENATKRMTKRYALDAKQVPKVKAENLAFATQIEPLRGKGKETKPQRVALRKNHRAALKSIFTPEQYAQFEADRAAAKAKRKARRAANKGKAPKTGEAAKDKTDLYAMLGDDDEDEEDEE